MARKGHRIRNNITGEDVEFLETAAETNGKHLRFNLRVKAGGYVVVNHIHPKQNETFIMRNGQLKMLVGKENRYLEEGETITIPKGQAHQWWNDTNEEVLIEVLFEPAGNMEIFLEQFFGMCNDGITLPDGNLKFMQAMAMTKKYDLYLSAPPVPLQKFLASLLGPVARMMGNKNFDPKYALK